MVTSAATPRVSNHELIVFIVSIHSEVWLAGTSLIVIGPRNRRDRTDQ